MKTCLAAFGAALLLVACTADVDVELGDPNLPWDDDPGVDAGDVATPDAGVAEPDAEAPAPDAGEPDAPVADLPNWDGYYQVNIVVNQGTGYRVPYYMMITGTEDGEGDVAYNLPTIANEQYSTVTVLATGGFQLAPVEHMLSSAGNDHYYRWDFEEATPISEDILTAVGRYRNWRAPETPDGGTPYVDSTDNVVRLMRIAH